MKTLLKIDSDADTTIVSGEVHTKEELYELAVALANLFLSEEDLSDAVLKSLDILLSTNKREEKETQEPIVLDIQSLINNKHKS